MMTKEKFLTVRWNNILSLALGLPALIYVITVLSTSAWPARADLIVLAGNTEIEGMGEIQLPFCGGRTDAKSDAGASDYLKPKIMGLIDENAHLLKEFINLMGLTNYEYAALHGAGYVFGQSKDCDGLYCRRDQTSTGDQQNIFFNTLLNNRWERRRIDGKEMYATKDDIRDLRMYSADVQFYFDPELKHIAEDYASNNTLFFYNFASAWNKLSNSDRFNGPTGNICDEGKF